MTQDKPIPATHEGVLETIAESLDISEAQFKEAESRYQAVGDWLNRDDSVLKLYDPQVSPQGSFALGTVVRPLNDKDDFDIDLVCLLNGTKAVFTQKLLKEAVGHEVRRYVMARSMTSPPEEGRRHWTLHYAGDTRFHLDVLPALPDSLGFRKRLLESGHVALVSDFGLIGEAIAITDKMLPTYDQITDDWPQSNPKGYAAWFRREVFTQLQERKRIVARRGVTASVDDIPDYTVKTPLQRVIQLLKRHRDWRFVGDHRYKPKSIVLTTLAAHSYRRTETITDALRAILDQMDTHIEEREGEPWIPNPADPTENFARDWVQDQNYHRMFLLWRSQAREDFKGYLGGSHRTLPDALKAALGTRLVEGVFRKLPQLVPAVAAPAILMGPTPPDPSVRASAAVRAVRERGSQGRPWAE